MRGIVFAIVIAALVSVPSVVSAGQASKPAAKAAPMPAKAGAAPGKVRATTANPVNLNTASAAQL